MCVYIHSYFLKHQLFYHLIVLEGNEKTFELKVVYTRNAYELVDFDVCKIKMEFTLIVSPSPPVKKYKTIKKKKHTHTVRNCILPVQEKQIRFNHTQCDTPTKIFFFIIHTRQYVMRKYDARYGRNNPPPSTVTVFLHFYIHIRYTFIHTHIHM